MSQKKVQIKKTLGQQTEDQLVNYPSPKDNGLVTAHRVVDSTLYRQLD